MRILHLTYKKKKGELLSDYLTLLITNEKTQSAEVEVATTKKEFSKMLSSFKPDIVHIHTCWKLNAFACAKKAKRSGCALLFSPHGELSPLAMKSEEPLRKKIRSVAYQLKTVRMVDAVLATSKQEMNDIAQIGWNKRIDCGPSCLLIVLFLPMKWQQTCYKFVQKLLTQDTDGIWIALNGNAYVLYCIQGYSKTLLIRLYRAIVY